MLRMLVKNVVEDYHRWRTVFDEQTDAAQAAGLAVERIYQDADRPNTVYVVFTVADRDKADAFVNDPASADVGERAGVTDGELTYIKQLD